MTGTRTAPSDPCSSIVPPEGFEPPRLSAVDFEPTLSTRSMHGGITKFQGLELNQDVAIQSGADCHCPTLESTKGSGITAQLRLCGCCAFGAFGWLSDPSDSGSAVQEQAVKLRRSGHREGSNLANSQYSSPLQFRKTQG